MAGRNTGQRHNLKTRGAEAGREGGKEDTVSRRAIVGCGGFVVFSFYPLNRSSFVYIFALIDIT